MITKKDVESLIDDLTRCHRIYDSNAKSGSNFEVPLRIILNAIPEAYSEREWYELPKEGLVAKKVGKAYNRAKGDLQERLGADRF